MSRRSIARALPHGYSASMGTDSRGNVFVSGGGYNGTTGTGKDETPNPTDARLRKLTVGGVETWGKSVATPACDNSTGLCVDPRDDLRDLGT